MCDRIYSTYSEQEPSASFFSRADCTEKRLDLAAGEYPDLAGKVIGRNDIDSLVLPPHLSLQAYSHPNYQEKTASWPAGSIVPSLAGATIGLNDIDSLKLIPVKSWAQWKTDCCAGKDNSTDCIVKFRGAGNCPAPPPAYVPPPPVPTYTPPPTTTPPSYTPPTTTPPTYTPPTTTPPTYTPPTYTPPTYTPPATSPPTTTTQDAAKIMGLEPTMFYILVIALVIGVYFMMGDDAPAKRAGPRGAPYQPYQAPYQPSYPPAYQQPYRPY